MGYREYVESAIVESGLEETDELLEILEEATTADDLEAIEEYLTEKKGCGEKLSTNEKLAALGAGSVKGRTPASAAKNAYKGVRASHAYKAMDKAGGSAEAWNKAAADFDKGAIAAGAAGLLAAVAGASLAVRHMVKSSKDNKSKQIIDDIKDLEAKAKDIEKRCKAGEITAKEAKVETKKIQAKMKKLEAEAQKVAAAEAKATKESVDITDIQLAIFESCEAGVISEEDRDDLLGLLED